MPASLHRSGSSLPAKKNSPMYTKRLPLLTTSPSHLSTSHPSGDLSNHRPAQTRTEVLELRRLDPFLCRRCHRRRRGYPVHAPQKTQERSLHERSRIVHHDRALSIPPGVVHAYPAVTVSCRCRLTCRQTWSFSAGDAVGGLDGGLPLEAQSAGPTGEFPFSRVRAERCLRLLVCMFIESAGSRQFRPVGV